MTTSSNDIRSRIIGPINPVTISAGAETVEPVAELNSEPGVAQVAEPEDHVRQLKIAFDECGRASKTDGFLVGSEIRRAKLLVPAYNFYQVCQKMRPEIVKHFIKNACFDERDRAPSARNPAMLAIVTTFRPEGEEQQKLCSELTCILVHAHDCGKSVEEFFEWTKGITLKECKTKVREKRRQIKDAVASTRSHPSTTQVRVAISLGTLKRTCLLTISEASVEDLSTIIGGSDALSETSLLKLLRAIANERENSQA